MMLPPLLELLPERHHGVRILIVDDQPLNIRVLHEAMGFEAGAVDFITKPINPITVMARVRTHLTLKLQSDILRSVAMIDGLTGAGGRSHA